MTESVSATTTELEADTESGLELVTTGGGGGDEFHARDLCVDAECEHVCMMVVLEGATAVQCSCRDGFRLEDDGRHCQGKGGNG